MIKVVGLGCEEGQLTLKGAQVINESKKVYVRTALTETYNYFLKNNIENIPLDYIYEEAENFDTLDSKIVDILLKEEDACYCVNGSGFDDRTVLELQKKAKIEIYPSVSLGSSFEKASLSVLKISAYELISNKGFNYDTRTTLVVTDVDNNYVASDIKLVLSNILGDEQEVEFNGKKIQVFEIDRQEKYDYKTTIICEPINLIKKYRFNFLDLYLIMKILRSENGCEWDKAQNHESIRENILEEAYEMVDAINSQDIENMIEENGDLTLQAIFHMVIGEDLGEYNTEDALTGICKKLIFRHPHIFGDIKATNKEEALKAWENAKAKEKKYTKPSSKMDSIAKALPSIEKAKKVLSIAKKNNALSPELKDAINAFNEAYKNYIDEKTEDLAGKMMLSLIYVLYLMDIDPEVALSKELEKFIENFKKQENNEN
jgi:tetrapyrrole methylase family protein / MazG family protein